MRADQIFGVLLVLLAIWLGINATGRDNVDVDIFGGGGGGDGDSADRGTDGAGGQTGGATDTTDDEPAEGLVDTSAFCESAPQTSDFTDLGDTHAADVRCLQASGIVNGASDTTYAPWDDVTRGQTAAIMARMIAAADELAAQGADLEPLGSSDAPARFTDVPSSNVHADAIARLDELGIVEGYVDSRYEPDQNVTRAQMASIIDRAHEYMTGDALKLSDNAFSDDDNSVHHDAINALAAADIVAGRSASRYEPNQGVRRGQMASIVARTMAHMAQDGRITPLP